jgi:hypothetical protein
MSDPIRDDRSKLAHVPVHTVYLCGPITGTSLSEATRWRQIVAAALSGQAEIIDPTRDTLDLTRRSGIAATRALTAERLLHGKRTVARDRFDVRRCDLVLACFLGAEHASIGSIGEIFWADVMGKPVIIVREEDNPHNHDMLNDIAGWIFDNLHQAIEQVRKLIRTGVSA